jgi:hypothetical protein
MTGWRIRQGEAAEATMKSMHWTVLAIAVALGGCGPSFDSAKYQRETPENGYVDFGRSTDERKMILAYGCQVEAVQARRLALARQHALDRIYHYGGMPQRGWTACELMAQHKGPNHSTVVQVGGKTSIQWEYIRGSVWLEQDSNGGWTVGHVVWH